MIPAPPERLTPRLAAWKAGRTLYRVHPRRFNPVEFNPGRRGRRGRFHPIHDGAGRTIPTLYATDYRDGALSESVYRELVGGDRLLRAALHERCITEIELLTDITVADLTAPGLRAIGLNRRQLLECGESHYRSTARWAEAIHRSNPAIQGMIWVSRQFDLATALLAYGDRLSENDLAIAKGPIPLDHGEGLSLVHRAATEAGIVVVAG